MQTSNVLVFALYPAAAVMAGGMIALRRRMKPDLISAAQHFTPRKP
jgi:hypothetical protein